jgi:hypothetical protein
MRYLVRARVKQGSQRELREAIASGRLGEGSVAEGEYLRNMREARTFPDETVRWVEVCYCPTPLREERPYWEEYFELVKVQDAHDRRKCRDQNGSEPWACGDCDCTARLEEKLRNSGELFQERLERLVKEFRRLARHRWRSTLSRRPQLEAMALPNMAHVAEASSSARATPPRA